MPFSVLSWNVQRLSPQSERLPHIQQVLDKYRADVVFVSEVSHDLQLDGYTEVGHAMSLNQSKNLKYGNIFHKSNNNNSNNNDTNEKKSRKNPDLNQLNMKLFVHNSALSRLNVSAKNFRLVQGQRRMEIKGVIREGNRIYTMSFIHANASKKGGGRALNSSEEQVSKGTRDIIVGDRNANLNDAKVFAAASNNGQLIQATDAQGDAEMETHKSSRSQSRLDYANAADWVKIVPMSRVVDTRKMQHPSNRPQRGVTRLRYLHLSDHRPLAFKVG
jgi:endonuclease/exonuclease/phosphatase family metal-dependent hydrolase